LSIYTDIDGGSLVLRDMTRSDAGVYECVANNIAGTETAASEFDDFSNRESYLPPPSISLYTLIVEFLRQKYSLTICF